MRDHDLKALDPERFEQLVNEFMTSIQGYSYVPGDPAGGPDRGFDGYFHGRIPFLGSDSPSGHWLVQAKRYRSKPSPACGQLKQDLVGPPKKGKPCLVDQAREAGATLILLLTTAGLQVHHVRKLQDAVSEQGLHLEVIAREKLRPLLDKRPWLRRQCS